MELPAQFIKFDYLITIIRKHIFADYLLTKQECLRFYCRNIINYSPYKCDYGLGGSLAPFLGYSYDHYQDKTIHYNIKTCSSSENGVVKELIDDDIFKLLNSAKENEIKIIFENTIRPPHKDIENLIEKEYDKKIFPLFNWDDKNLLLETQSAKFIIHFAALFENVKLINYHIKGEASADNMITIVNNFNDYKFRVGKNVFVTYCGFNDLITQCEENVKIITTPFAFNSKAGLFIIKSLIGGMMENFIGLSENDVEEIKSLISFLQINLDDKQVLKKKIIWPY